MRTVDPDDYVDYRLPRTRERSSAGARRRTPASGVHINFDKQLRVTTDRRIVSAILDFRCSLSRRDNIRGAHDDLDIASDSAADVRHGFGARPLRAIAVVSGPVGSAMNRACSPRARV